MTKIEKKTVILPHFLIITKYFMSQFTDFGLNSALLKAIGELGFENPMPIQEQAIPVLLEQDVDFVGLAQTGTGKTAAFGLPLLLTSRSA